MNVSKAAGIAVLALFACAAAALATPTLQNVPQGQYILVVTVASGDIPVGNYPMDCLPNGDLVVHDLPPPCNDPVTFSRNGTGQYFGIPRGVPYLGEWIMTAADGKAYLAVQPPPGEPPVADGGGSWR